ncbi:MAG: Flp/Fap pilin component [Aliidongia sp.]|nr:Flp/Fap pilin component [Aliidongia sp.]
MSKFIRGFARDAKGIAALEYALIAGLMFALIVGGVAVMGSNLMTAFTNIGISLSSNAKGT